MTIAGDEAVKRYLDQAFWPWGVALAYCQPVDDRERAIAAVIAGLELYASHDRGQSYAGAASYSGVTGGQKLGWSDFATVEQRLLGPVQAGQIEVVGRASPTGRLEPIPVVDWVGGEVDYDHTCDLVRAGWRDKDPLGQALDGPRQTIWYDLHLAGPAVRQLADAIDVHATESDDEAALFHLSEMLNESAPAQDRLWSPWVVCAWIATRDDAWTGGVQRFEAAYFSEYSWPEFLGACWLQLEGLAKAHSNCGMVEAFEALKLALENGDLLGGSSDQCESIAQGAWRGLLDHPAFERGETVFHKSHSNLRWPSKEVRSAFAVRARPISVVPQATRFVTKADTEAWYRERVQNWGQCKPPSREDDIKAGRLVGIGAARVRELRNSMAPTEWRARGRPIGG